MSDGGAYDAATKKQTASHNAMSRAMTQTLLRTVIACMWAYACRKRAREYGSRSTMGVWNAYWNYTLHPDLRELHRIDCHHRMVNNTIVDAPNQGI